MTKYISKDVNFSVTSTARIKVPQDSPKIESLIKNILLSRLDVVESNQNASLKDDLDLNWLKDLNVSEGESIEIKFGDIWEEVKLNQLIFLVLLNKF